MQKALSQVSDTLRFPWEFYIDENRKDTQAGCLMILIGEKQNSVHISKIDYSVCFHYIDSKLKGSNVSLNESSSLIWDYKWHFFSFILLLGPDSRESGELWNHGSFPTHHWTQHSCTWPPATTRLLLLYPIIIWLKYIFFLSLNFLKL